MVNKRQSASKTAILTALREKRTPVSGEKLGLKLGMSRVAVFKHVLSLREAGYTLTSNRHGYRLVESGIPPLNTWEFQTAEQITVMDAVSSTMDEAHRRAGNGDTDDFVLAARTQKSGRGRLGREWKSPAGGLWATRVIHPGGSSLDFQKYVMGAAAGLAHHLREKMGLDAKVKWPNDVLINARKAAGILGEARLSGDRIVYLALGMGLNVNNDTPPDGIALRRLTGREEDRRILLRGWLASSDALMSSAEFRERGHPGWWNTIMEGRGRKAEITAGGVRRRGTATGVDGLGRLNLHCDTGEHLRIPAGDLDSAVWKS